MDTLIRMLFVCVGGKFYMDWILITNPQSKNPLFKLIWSRVGNVYYGGPKSRLQSAYVNGAIHSFFLMLSLFLHYDRFINGVFINDLLVNIYPIIVQLYIGYRCKRVLNHRKRYHPIYIYSNKI